MATLFDTPSADFDEDGTVTGSDFLAWQRNVGTLVGAVHGQGDANGDGDVDRDDLAIFNNTVVTMQLAGGGASGGAAGSAAGGANGVPLISPVPEPAAALLGFVAWGALAVLRGRRNA